jgi:hypothetical protein
MLESLTIFVALMLVAQFAGKTNAGTTLGAQLFFWGRLAYAPGLCHRDSMASYSLVGRFVRGVVTNPFAASVGIEAPSSVRSAQTSAVAIAPEFFQGLGAPARPALSDRR